MIIWRNEANPDGLDKDAPQGPVEITRIDKPDGNFRIWFAPVPAVPAVEGMMPDPVGMLTAMAGMHHEWFEAWQLAGFSEEQAFGLVAEVVRSAFS